jgi:hypothetical protein
VGGFADDVASGSPVQNIIDAPFTFNAPGATLFSDRSNADAGVNGIVRFNNVNVNASHIQLATRNLVDLEIGTLNITANTIVRADGGAFEGQGAIRFGNVTAGTSALHFQNGRTTITGNLTSGTLTVGGTSLEFNPGASSTSSESASSVKINSMLAAKSGTVNFGNTILESVPVGTTVARLRERRIAGTGIDSNSANPASSEFEANVYSDTNLGIRLDPRAGMNNFSGAAAIDPKRGWSNNEMWIYTGQVFDADGLFTFAEQIDDSVEIKIDGERVLFNRNSGAGGIASVGSGALGGSGTNGGARQAPFQVFQTVTNTSTKEGLANSLQQALTGPGTLAPGLADTLTRNTKDSVETGGWPLRESGNDIRRTGATVVTTRTEPGAITMDQLITIVSFNEREPADKLATRLRDAGFQAEVRDESQEQKWKLFNLYPRAHIQVLVPEAECDRALGQITDWDRADGALRQAQRCPECGSTRVEYPQFSRRTLMGSLPAMLAATGVIERDFYCESCHFTWPAEPPKPEPELNLLGWPKRKNAA